jgi:excinuclease ABC subunit A
MAECPLCWLHNRSEKHDHPAVHGPLRLMVSDDRAFFVYGFAGQFVRIGSKASLAVKSRSCSSRRSSTVPDKSDEVDVVESRRSVTSGHAEPAIRIRGARTHNLKNVNVDLPAGKLIVMTGVSGSGKSSLAFDTLFAEGQRRYLESVSVQTRTLLRLMPRPDVDDISGLAPTVAVDQRASNAPARSTLATSTEIHDFLRLLYARAGTAHCTSCGQPVQRQSVDQILQQILELPDRTKLMILSPLVRARKGTHREVIERIARHGFVRARIDGTTVDVSDQQPLDSSAEHSIEAVIDRVVIKEGIDARVRESVDLACRESNGTCIVSWDQDGVWKEKFYSTRYCCPDCDLNFPTPEPRSFSFNSPRGACPACSGLGIQGAVTTEHSIPTFHKLPCSVCHGTRLQPFPRAMTFLGITIGEFLRNSVEDCLKIVSTWISQSKLSATAVCMDSPERTMLTSDAKKVADRTLPDIQSRLQCLTDVGVGYLTLDRPTTTLSGGEYQRARLAAALSSQLYGAHFILDEPTAGLHPRDTHRLLQTLFRLRDTGGTVIVVEHDPDVIQAADWIVDLGPGAGIDGGHLLFSGTPADALQLAQSPTGEYLRRRISSGTTDLHAADSSQSLQGNSGVDAVHAMVIRNARLHNLKSVIVEIPLNRFVCVSGVSGSGKSSLITGTLLPVLEAVLLKRQPLETICADVHCDSVDGLEHIQRVVALNQNPPGRSSRSCIATLCGIWDEIRRLYVKTRDARARGISASQFSFNSGDGRCPECRGTGLRNLRMSFLPDAVIPCPVCHGRRFRPSILSISFRQKSVADVLQMRVDEAVEFFSEFQKLRTVLETFRSVGLGYLTLGQPATTFSGGESQRVKLASELSMPVAEHTLYVLDEPTSGLHPADIDRLLQHLRKLIQAGHSLVVVEHHPDMIRAADWVIDLGPDCADRGGEVVFNGTPARLLQSGIGETASALRRSFPHKG